MNDGRYWAQVLSLVCGMSSTKKPQMVVQLNVSHEAANGEWQELAQPQQRRMYWSPSDAAMPYSTEKLERIGFNGDFSAPDCSDTAKGGVEVECKHEQYNGKDQEKWDMPSAGSEIERAPDDQLRLLTAKWKNQHGAKKAPTGKPPAPPTAAPATGTATVEEAYNAVCEAAQSLPDKLSSDDTTKLWRSVIKELCPTANPDALTPSECWTIKTQGPELAALPF
jgi:hypothetical protein